MQARSAVLTAAAYQIQCHQAWCTTFVAGGFLVSSAALFAIAAGVRPCGWVDAWVRCARCALFVACAVPAPRVLATSVLPCAAAPMRSLSARWPPRWATRSVELSLRKSCWSA